MSWGHIKLPDPVGPWEVTEGPETTEIEFLPQTSIQVWAQSQTKLVDIYIKLEHLHHMVTICPFRQYQYSVSNLIV